MSFFDEGDEPRTAIRSPRPQPRRPAPRGRRPPIDDRTLAMRRGIAGLAIVAVIIVIVLVIKSVVDSQNKSGLQTYANDVSSIFTPEQTTIKPGFFHELDVSYTSGAINVENALQQYVNQEQSYYREAQSWSVPSQLVGAQRYYVEALGLRAEALAGIEAQMRAALAPTPARQALAIDLIAGDMEKLLAADVMYSDRAAPLIDEALASAGVSATAPTGNFLPDITWIQPSAIAQRILGYVPTKLGGGAPPPSGVSVGHELSGVSVRTASGQTIPLDPSGVNHIPLTTAGVTFELALTNSGQLRENGVVTQLTFHKTGLPTGCLSETGEVAQTLPGHSYTSPILFAPTSCSNTNLYYDQVLLLTAGVEPVVGEKITSNNYQTFDVDFVH